MEKLIIKHYSSDERPTVKGYGFDGLEIGEDREEAEEFIDFINKLISQLDRRNITNAMHPDGESQCVYPAGVGVCGFGDPDTNICNYLRR